MSSGEATTDILALLRTWDSPVDSDNIREVAAQTIERLTAALRDIEALKRSQGDELGDARTIARKALCQ